MSEEDKLTDEELLSLLSSLDEEGSLTKKLFEANNELLETVYDYQEFMEEHNLTSQQFHDWKQQKNMRMYH